MKKYYSVFFILCSLFLYSNAQAQFSLEGLIEASQEAERKRISEAPQRAPTFIPRARNQSRLGSFLVEQLTIQSEDPETNKRTARKIRTDIKKIGKDLNKLDAAIADWEQEIYSKKLDKLTATFSKHTKKYNNIVVVEQARIAAVEQARIAAAKAEQERIAAAKAVQKRIAAAKKTEQERIAAAKRAEQERIAAAKRAEEARIAAAELKAYQARCEPGSDDPFAAFNAAGETRLNLLIDLGSARMKLQATIDGSCMWLGNATNPGVTPVLLIEESYLQNPNAKSQYIVYNNKNNPGIQSITPAMKFVFPTPGAFSLDFATYECAFQIAGSSTNKLTCDDGAPLRLTDIKDIVTANCVDVIKLSNKNSVAFIDHFEGAGLVRLGECAARGIM